MEKKMILSDLQIMQESGPKLCLYGCSRKKEIRDMKSKINKRTKKT